MKVEPDDFHLYFLCLEVWVCKTREIPIFGKNGKIVISVTKL